jgi:hypothetical protein
MEWFSSSIANLGPVADILGILGAIFAFFAWLQTSKLRQEYRREQDRQNRKVTVILQNGADRLELPMELRRAELTRAEILGRLGMIPMKERGRRFSLGYLNTPEFLSQINKIASNDGDDILTIPCKQDEFDQFDIDGSNGDSNIRRRSTPSPVQQTD